MSKEAAVVHIRRAIWNHLRVLRLSSGLHTCGFFTYFFCIIFPYITPAFNLVITYIFVRKYNLDFFTLLWNNCVPNSNKQFSMFISSVENAAGYTQSDNAWFSCYYLSRYAGLRTLRGLYCAIWSTARVAAIRKQTYTSLFIHCLTCLRVVHRR